MSIIFEKHTIPEELSKEVNTSKEDFDKINIRLRSVNRKLSHKMKSIDYKENNSWKKSNIRN